MVRDETDDEVSKEDEVLFRFQTVGFLNLIPFE